MSNGLLDSLFNLSAQPPQQRGHNWQGANGKWFMHLVYGIDAIPPLGSANYIFVRRNPDGTKTALYAGMTTDLETRLQNHHKWNAALRLGMNEVHIHYCGSGIIGLSYVESQMIDGHTPILNEKRGIRGLGGLFNNS